MFWRKKKKVEERKPLDMVQEYRYYMKTNWPNMKLRFGNEDEELVEINYNGNKIKVSKSIKEKLENNNGR